MANYSKDIREKFKVKVLKDVCGYEFPTIADLLGITRGNAHYRYNTISDEISIYEDTRAEYMNFLQSIKSVKFMANFEFAV